MMMETVPYSAQHPVSPKNFAGRTEEITEFKRFLDNTLGGNSKNIAVLGKWGIGKTSLLRISKEIAEEKDRVSSILERGRCKLYHPLLKEYLRQVK